MEKLRELKALNPELKLYSVEDPEFTEYGKIVTGYDFGEILEIMNRRAIPAEGNVYVAKDEEMMKTAASAAISERFYGHMPIEIGYCNGNSYQLNAFEYQCGRANIKSTAVNILKGFFACSLIGIVPVELYKFCISLQNTFSHDLSALFAGGRTLDLAGESTSVLQGSFAVSTNIQMNLFNILALIAFAYCVVKIFFANIKRGGILLIQMAVGALYMFSVPRGYQDGFNQWMKQIAALCLTAFMQTSANEVPRIAQQFGLDSSVRVNMMSVVHATTTAVNLTRSVARAAGK